MELIISKNSKQIDTDVLFLSYFRGEISSEDCVIGLEHGGHRGESSGFKYEPLITAINRKYKNIYFGYSTSFLESVWYINLMKILHEGLSNDGNIFAFVEGNPGPGRLSFEYLQNSVGEWREVSRIPLWKRIFRGYDKILRRGLSGTSQIYCTPKKSFCFIESIIGKFHSNRDKIVDIASVSGESGKHDSTESNSVNCSNAISDLSYYITGASYKSPILKHIVDTYDVKVKSVLDFGGGFGAISGDLAQSINDSRVTVDVADHSSKNELLAGELKGFDRGRWGSNMTFFRTTIEDYILEKDYEVILFIGSMLYVDRKKLSGVIKRAWDRLAHNGLLIVHENIQHKSYSRDYDKMFTARELEHYLSPYGNIAYYSSSSFAELNSITSKFQTVFRVVQKIN